jgi:hypothetical protein
MLQKYPYALPVPGHGFQTRTFGIRILTAAGLKFLLGPFHVGPVYTV